MRYGLHCKLSRVTLRCIVHGVRSARAIYTHDLLLDVFIATYVKKMLSFFNLNGEVRRFDLPCLACAALEPRSRYLFIPPVTYLFKY